MEYFFKKAFKELRLQFISLAGELAFEIQKGVQVVANEQPSGFGRLNYTFTNSTETKRVCLDIFATGKVVFDLQSKPEGFGLFPEPDLDPVPERNYFDMQEENSFDNLVEKIKNHLRS